MNEPIIVYQKRINDKSSTLVCVGAPNAIIKTIIRAKYRNEIIIPLYEARENGDRLKSRWDSL